MNTLQKQIDDLKPWYQKIDLNGTLTTTSKQSDISVWNKICNLVGGKEKFINSNVLDLGCNAGLYSIMAAISGASSVVGVELNSPFYEQALFIKSYFDGEQGRTLPITYIKKNISDINFNEFPKFDYIFALAVLYHVGKHQYGRYTERALLEQEIVIERLCNISNCIIVRGKKHQYSNQARYDSIFKKFGFKNCEVIDEGKRMLIRYDRI